jgi:hypothetical protein
VAAGHRSGAVVVRGGLGLGGEAFQHGRGEERSSVRGGMLRGSSGAFTSAKTPPTHGLDGPVRTALACGGRGASGAGWAKGRVGR